MGLGLLCPPKWQKQVFCVYAWIGVFVRTNTDFIPCEDIVGQWGHQPVLTSTKCLLKVQTMLMKVLYTYINKNINTQHKMGWITTALSLAIWCYSRCGSKHDPWHPRFLWDDAAFMSWLQKAKRWKISLYSHLGAYGIIPRLLAQAS